MSNKGKTTRGSQKEYRVLVMDGKKPVVVSVNSLEYAEYIDSGYNEDTIDCKRECIKRLDELLNQYENDSD